MAINYQIKMPVPRWPVGDRLVIGDRAIFHLIYLDSWRVEPPPTIGPVGLWEPIDIFHPNGKPDLRGALCLGEHSLPPGISPKELVLLAYFSVSLQFYMLDESDPAHVFNPAASEYFRCHSEYLPLTRAGLYDEWQAEKETS